MSLVSNTELLATRIGAEFKTVRTEASAIAAARYTKSEADAAISTAVSGVAGSLGKVNAGAFSSTDVSVYADSSRTPQVDPNNFGGWYFKNITAGQKINWYPYNAGVAISGSPTYDELTAVWAVVSFYKTTSNFVFNVYSKKTGTGDAGSWYKSRWTRSAKVGTIPAPAAAGQAVKMLVFLGVDPGIHPELPRLQISNTMNSTSTIGPRLGTEEIFTYSWGTNSGSAIGTEEFTIEQFGHKMRDQMFMRSLVHVGASAADVALKADSSTVNAALALKADAASVYTKVASDAALAAKADASAVYSKSEADVAVSTAVNNLIGAAPGTLDTLAEIAAAIEADQTAGAALVQGLALKANSVDVYTKPEVDAAIAGIQTGGDTGDIVFSGGTMLGSQGDAKLSVQNTTTTGSYSLAAGVDYSTAVWDNDAITFNDTTQSLYEAVWALSGQFDTISLMINGSPVLATSTGSSTPGAPQPLVLFVNETAVGGPLTVDAVEITTRTGGESFLEISGKDLEIDVEDDIRIYGSDTFRLSNRSSTQGISIQTNDGDHEWDFNQDGNLVLPDGGDIKDVDGNSVLGGAKIDDETPSSTTVYSSSKIDGMFSSIVSATDLGDVSTNFVATFEAALA